MRLTSEANVEYRRVAPGDEEMLADLFRLIDTPFFQPHPLTPETARGIANDDGHDIYSVLVRQGRAVAYGMLRGLDEGYSVPTLGIAVDETERRRGLGTMLISQLHSEARGRGATVVRLRVHPDNAPARQLYEGLGYMYAGEDRGELVMLHSLRPRGESALPHNPTSLCATLVDPGSQEWETSLASARHDFYHLPAYVQMCAEGEGALARGLIVGDGVRSLLLPLLMRDLGGGWVDAISPYGFPGPIGHGVEDPGFLEVALAAGLQALREAGAVSAFLRLHPLLNQTVPEGIGTVVIHGDCVIIDLTLSPEELWSQMRRNHRVDITRAGELGYRARMDASAESFETFKRLYRETMARRGAATFYCFDDEYFERLVRALGDRQHLCIVEGGGQTVAAGIFVETDGIVEAHLVGTDMASRAIQPTKLMFHYVSLWARDRGARALHLGGGVGASADSLLRFKAGFSPLRLPFASVRAVIDEAEYDRRVGELDKDLDPMDRTGYFPRYRTPEPTDDLGA